MRELMEELGAWFWVLVVGIVTVVAGFAVWAMLAPMAARVQNDANHNSPGYYAARIDNLRIDILNYNKLDPNTDQAKVILGDFCSIYQDKAVYHNPNNPANIDAFARDHC